jgi:hypothetical protein
MRVLRAASAIAALACWVGSFVLIARIIGLGFAIGDWIGLKGYEQQIADAQKVAIASQWQLVPPQILGGVCAFVTLRSNRLSGWWLPLFPVAFAASTLIGFLAIIGIVSEFHQSPRFASAILVGSGITFGVWHRRRKRKATEHRV